MQARWGGNGGFVLSLPLKQALLPLIRQAQGFCWNARYPFCAYRIGHICTHPLALAVAAVVALLAAFFEDVGAAAAALRAQVAGQHRGRGQRAARGRAMPVVHAMPRLQRRRLLGRRRCVRGRRRGWSRCKWDRRGIDG